MSTKLILYCSAACVSLPSAAAAWSQTSSESISEPPAEASPAAGLPEYEDEDSQTIVVTGARSSVIGNIPPENVLTTRDVMATGATDINELLDAIAPQIGSARGRGGERPVMLLNGQRISSFRELRDIPTEAVARVEILPEEVALRYGYRADQKVVNFVLRARFRSTAGRLEGTTATEGGYLGGEADLTRLMIGERGRTTIDIDLEGNSPLTENERDIVPEDSAASEAQAARTLIGSRRQYRATLTHNRMIGAVSSTGNAEVQRVTGRSFIGLGDTSLIPLARETRSDTAHAGIALAGNLSGWRWSVTGNGDVAHGVTDTDRDSPTVADRGETTAVSGDLDAMANGSLFKVPAGDVGTTVKVGASTLHLDSERRRNGVESSNSLGRTVGQAAINLDFPVSRRDSEFGTLGNLTLNANGEIEQLSDFGTLSTIGAGANWSPAKRLNLIASWTREDGPPTIQQLGDPVLETPGSRIFDFTTGETVLATAITGGNADLRPDRRNVVKLGANWKPLEDTDLTVRGEYVRSTIGRPIANFPGPTAALEAAFPDRFVRDSQGQLVSVDFRPVNYDSARQDSVRIGIDFSKPLKSAAPSPAAIAAFRARRERSAAQSDSEASPPRGTPAESGSPEGTREGAPQSSQSSQGGPPTGAESRAGGGFGRFGGRNGGRLQFSLADTITLVDRVTIRDGVDLDYLHGDAIGQGGGRPRHQVEARAGYFNNGLGARLSANWRSGTQVAAATGDTLRFSPLATFDLRLWANLGQRFDMVAKHPWLRGTSVRLEVKNLLDSKQKVRDSSSDVPFTYQPDYLDPLGRTVSISIRKLFLRPPSFFRRSASGGGED